MLRGFIDSRPVWLLWWFGRVLGERLVRLVNLPSTSPVIFSLTVCALFTAKLVHLWAHLASIPLGDYLLWGLSFFFMDIVFVLLARVLTHDFDSTLWRLLSLVTMGPISLMLSGMAASNTGFYIVTGAEIHWRKAHSFHLDAAAIRTLLSGLTVFLVVEGFLLVGSWFVASWLYRFFGAPIMVLGQPFTRIPWPVPASLRRRWMQRQKYQPAPNSVESVGLMAEGDFRYHDEDDDVLNENTAGSSGGVPSQSLLEPPGHKGGEGGDKEQKSRPPPTSLLVRLAILSPLLLLIILRVIRPFDPAFLYLSMSLPLSPFQKARELPPGVREGNLPGQYEWLGNATALGAATPFSWLPPDGGKQLDGFRDWVLDRHGHPRMHYDPKKDPLHISNLDNDVLEPLRKPLADGDVRIKHVILLKLESTRGDVFPLRNGSFIWDEIQQSYGTNDVPEEVQKRVANLTRTAERLTGFSAGFGSNISEPTPEPYGGLSARNAVTTCTYTLKSLTGTVCGVTPMVADFNREYFHHIYQPCLPHVFNAFNEQPEIKDNDPNPDDFTTWPWHVKWMQSVTDSYDAQDRLSPVLGFDDVITKEVLQGVTAKYPPTTDEVNYYGYADTELKPYLRDAIDDAERDHERLFLTHLTGTTHHPWGIPGENYEELLSHSWRGRNNDFNRYLNTIGFVDNWLAEILDLLEEKGIANETLIAMAGDHGLSLPNDGGATPYDNPHIGSFHIPIVLAHPQLPPVEIKTPVISEQIVPTILDLLIESSSLPTNGTAAARDLLPIYEGQSMIRELIPETDRDVNGTTHHVQDWQFTVMNTGGSWLAIRSAAKPAYRLVAPLIDDLEWRFTDLSVDPNEKSPYMDFDLGNLAKGLEGMYKDYNGTEEDVEAARQWMGDAAQVARWWVLDNWRRWEYMGEEEK